MTGGALAGAAYGYLIEWLIHGHEGTQGQRGCPGRT